MTRDDLSVMADLVAARGGEADRSAWCRVRAELDGLRRRLDVAHETLRLTGGGREQPRPEAIVATAAPRELHAFESVGDAAAYMDQHGAIWWMRLDPQRFVWHPARPDGAAATGEGRGWAMAEEVKEVRHRAVELEREVAALKAEVRALRAEVDNPRGRLNAASVIVRRGAVRLDTSRGETWER